MPKTHQNPTDSRKRQASLLRVFRKIHRWTGALLFVFFFAIAVTGGVLGWKKNTGDLILPKTRTGTQTNLRQWKPLHELYAAAETYYTAHYSPADYALDRLEADPEKGVLKVVFTPGFVGIQVDGGSGEILHAGKRNSDLFENLHDGSYVDDILGWGGAFKLLYTSVMSLALVLFTITGFWLWYGPKRLRRQRKG